MIPIPETSGQRLAILGFGRSGLAVARALESGGADVLCWDDDPEVREMAAGSGFGILPTVGDDDWKGVAGLAGLIVSPGVPHLYPEPHPLIRKAWVHGVAVDNDVGLFFRALVRPEWDEFDVLPRVVCVTGSNGKSTTTALIGHLLASAGKPVQVGGNIGRAVLDLDPPGDGEIVVLELSSFQIELARVLAPDIALFLNFSPDHIERHGGAGGYFAAKRRLFAEGSPEKTVIGVDEPEGESLAGGFGNRSVEQGPLIRVSTRRLSEDGGWSVIAERGFLSERRSGRQLASADLRELDGLKGLHNHQNACSAWAACRLLGLSPRNIRSGLASFRGLPHRCQTILEHGGVLFVNDSKATNADSASRALAAYRNIRWIAGGRAKSGGIASLGRVLDRVRKTYLVGESAETFSEQLGDRSKVISGTVAAAVAAAAAEAESGDVILLSPAAASYDQFASFEDRGDTFVRAVATVTGTAIRSESETVPPSVSGQPGPALS